MPPTVSAMSSYNLEPVVDHTHDLPLYVGLDPIKGQGFNGFSPFLRWEAYGAGTSEGESSRPSDAYKASSGHCVSRTLV